MAKRVLLLFLTIVTLSSTCAWARGDTGDTRHTNFNAGWRFLKGDAPGAEQPSFDDSKWRALDLPHDWAIEGPFDPKLNPHEGALPDFGTGWYRKRFALPASAKGKHVWIEFDGAMN